MDKNEKKLKIDQQSLIIFLRETLIGRCKKNESYSLRAFSRDLSIEASALSKIIRGERSISKNMFDRISSSLNLSPKERSEFLENDEADFKQINEDYFRVIADWYHFAILELTHLKSFQSDSKWISEKIGIPKQEVNNAVERLMRLKLLSKGKTGNWLDTGENLSTVSVKYTNSAFKKLQRGVLEKGIEALNRTPFEERDQSSMTLAFSKKEMPRAKELLKKYRRQFVKEMENYETADQIYHLSFCLYPLINERKKGENI